MRAGNWAGGARVRAGPRRGGSCVVRAVESKLLSVGSSMTIAFFFSSISFCASVGYALSPCVSCFILSAVGRVVVVARAPHSETIGRTCRTRADLIARLSNISAPPAPPPSMLPAPLSSSSPPAPGPAAEQPGAGSSSRKRQRSDSPVSPLSSKYASMHMPA